MLNEQTPLPRGQNARARDVRRQRRDVLGDEEKHEALLWSGSITRRVLAAQGRIEVPAAEFHTMRERLFAPMGTPALKGLQRAMLARQIITPDLKSTAKIRARVYTMIRLGWIAGERVPRRRLDTLVEAVQARGRPCPIGPEVTDVAQEQRTREGWVRLYQRKLKHLGRDAKLLAILEQRIAAEGVEIGWASTPPHFGVLRENEPTVED